MIRFNLLWFEDNEEWYEINKEFVEDYLREKNFTPIFTRYDSTDNIDNILTFDEYDLIFVDLNLDHDTKGTTAIQKIRERNILSDVLFYSVDGMNKIQEAMGEEPFEGVYFSPRTKDLFEDKTIRLINKAVRRMEDIISTRGMLIDSLSEFDEKLRFIIKSIYFAQIETKKKEELDDYAYDLIIKQLRENQTKCDQFKKNERFLESIIEHSYFLDSSKLAQMVQHIFNKYYPEKGFRKDFCESYKKKIIVERNHLAHAKKEVDEDGLFFFEEDGEKIIYNAEKCSEIRLNINNFDDEIKELMDFCTTRLKII